MINYIQQGNFSSDTQNTIGSEEYLSKTFTVDDTPSTLNVWDTAGQEKFRTITSSYYRGSQGTIIVFDLNNLDTFSKVPKWHEQVVKYSSKNSPIVLVGNKSVCKIQCNDNLLVQDLEINVDEDSIKTFAKKNKMIYVETSALSDKNVLEVFNSIVRIMRDHHEEQPED